jgi:hypothetical protein
LDLNILKEKEQEQKETVKTVPTFQEEPGSIAFDNMTSESGSMKQCSHFPNANNEITTLSSSLLESEAESAKTETSTSKETAQSTTSQKIQKPVILTSQTIDEFIQSNPRVMILFALQGKMDFSFFSFRHDVMFVINLFNSQLKVSQRITPSIESSMKLQRNLPLKSSLGNLLLITTILCCKNSQ